MFLKLTITSNADPNIFNPGLMQSHSGSATCMNKVPCPRDTVSTAASLQHE